MEFAALQGIQGIEAESFGLVVRVLQELAKQPDIRIINIYAEGSKHFILFTANNNKIKINLKGVAHVSTSRRL